MILPNENMYPDITWSSAFHSSFFLSVDECKFLHHDLKLLKGVDKEMSIPTLLKEKFVAILPWGGRGAKKIILQKIDFCSSC